MCELREDFELERALAHGTLPGIYSEPDSRLRNADLRGHADTYLREEIQAEILVRNLGGFSRLPDLVAASSGRILNLHALCGDVQNALLRRPLDRPLGRELWGIEVKAGANVTRAMLRGLASFAARSPRVRRRIVVFLGARAQVIDGVEILPLADFLALLPGGPADVTAGGV